MDMMTKLTTISPAAANSTNWKTTKQTARQAGTATETNFSTIVDKKLAVGDHGSVNKSNQTDNSREVQTKQSYVETESSKMDQLRNGGNGDKAVDKPRQEDFNEEELGQISALAASLQTVVQNTNMTDSEKLAASNGVLTDALEQINGDAKTMAASANALNKLQELLKSLQSANPSDRLTEASKNNLTELLSKLINKLTEKAGQTSTDESTSTARGISNQLLALLAELQDKNTAENAKGNDNKDLNALLQMLVNQSNQLLKGGQRTEEAGSTTKIEFSARLKDTVNSVLEAAKASTQEAGLKSTVETLVANLFTTDASNKSDINGILQRYGLLGSEGSQSVNKLELDELKKRLTEALMMLASKVEAGDEGSEKAGKGNDIVDKFSRLLDLNLKGTAVPVQQGNDTATADNKKGQNEDKLLNKLLGKDSGDDNKTTKLNTLINHLNNSKNDIEMDKLQDKPVITKGTISQDIIKTVKYMNLNNLKELTVKIMPRDLGEITIKLTMVDGNMKASIAANTKEAFSLLNGNVAEIRSSLENNTIKIQDVEINIYQEDASFNRDNANGQNNSQSGRNRSANRQNPSDKIESLEGTAQDDVDIDSKLSILI